MPNAARTFVYLLLGGKLKTTPNKVEVIIDMTEEQIGQSIETDELKLTAWGKFTHYGIVYFLFFIPAVQPFLYFKDLIKETLKGFNVGMLLFIVVPSALGLLFYRLQRQRLKFKIAETNLTRDELEKIIHQVATELKWTIFTNNKRVVEAKTFQVSFQAVGANKSLFFLTIEEF